MADDLVTATNVSKEMLYALFEGAYMEVSYDSDGDVRVRDGYRCWLLLDDDNQDLRLFTFFRFKPESSMIDRIALANKCNEQYKLVRACTEDDRLVYDYTLPLAGGVTKHSIVVTTRRFLKIVGLMVNLDAGSLLA
jgi:hypothetical protein